MIRRTESKRAITRTRVISVILVACFSRFSSAIVPRSRFFFPPHLRRLFLCCVSCAMRSRARREPHARTHTRTHAARCRADTVSTRFLYLVSSRLVLLRCFSSRGPDLVVDPPTLFGYDVISVYLYSDAAYTCIQGVPCDSYSRKSPMIMSVLMSAKRERLYRATHVRRKRASLLSFNERTLSRYSSFATGTMTRRNEKKKIIRQFHDRRERRRRATLRIAGIKLRGDQERRSVHAE